MTDPDMMNSLLGILLKFRRQRIAVTADIEKMFNGFLVKQEHRNFLKFFWYHDNNTKLDMIEYLMKVHVFEICASPAIATFGLHKIAADSQIEYGHCVKEFIERGFYVDDALTSLSTVEQLVDLVKCTQPALKENGKLRIIRSKQVAQWATIAHLLSIHTV